MITKYYSMLDDFELKGLWWLPQNPDEKLSGNLVFKGDESITLEVVGSFDPLEAWGNSEHQKDQLFWD